MKRTLFIFCLSLAMQHVHAQVDRDPDLHQTVLSLDSLLFSVGFNTCDIRQFEDLLSDNFEFFHDKDGISFKPDFIRNLRSGLCASPATYQSRRELVRESTGIHPLYKNGVLYGAIQKGSHRFYETISGGKETLAGSARFVNVWLLEHHTWKLFRCLSFDHL